MSKRGSFNPPVEILPDTMVDIGPINKPNPNELLNQFLQDNNLKLTVAALDQENPFVPNRGFVLTEKPLLVVSVEYK